MNAIEFTTELSGGAVLSIPDEVAAQLPKTGLARIIVLIEEPSGDALPAAVEEAEDDIRENPTVR